MQGTKPSFLQRNKILNLVLYSLGFVNHFIYYAMYTLSITSTKYALIVGYSAYDFLCDYSIIHLFKDLLAGINKYFSVNSKEGPQLYYLNIPIIQSPYGISIDQTAHILVNILGQILPLKIIYQIPLQLPLLNSIS